MVFTAEKGVLTARNLGEILRIEAWGKDSLRVRATRHAALNDENWALTEEPGDSRAIVEITKEDHWVGDGTMDQK